MNVTASWLSATELGPLGQKGYLAATVAHSQSVRQLTSIGWPDLTFDRRL